MPTCCQKVISPRVSYVHSCKSTYEDAKECQSRLPLIEPVIVLENEGECLPKLAHFFLLHEQTRVLFTPKKRYRMPNLREVSLSPTHEKSMTAQYRAEQAQI